jgi:hypothetical protein
MWFYLDSYQILPQYLVLEWQFLLIHLIVTNTTGPPEGFAINTVDNLEWSPGSRATGSVAPWFRTTGADGVEEVQEELTAHIS